MRKLLSILLSVAMTICVLQVAYVQVTALENEHNNYSTVDEANTDIEPVSIEVVNPPKEVVVLGGNIYLVKEFWKNLKIAITYNDGVVEYCNCGEVDFIVPKHSTDVTIRTFAFCDDNTYTVEFWVEQYNYISTQFSFTRIEHPYKVLECELTKLPNKIFAFPLWSGTLDNEDELKVDNSIANNMNGAELTVRYASGENKILTFGKDIKPITSTKKSTEYNIKLDDYNTLTMSINDLGNYEASVFISVDFKCNGHGEGLGEFFKFTAKSVDNSNPAKPSGNKTSSTSDTATKDSTNNNNGNGTQNNGVVATGSFATPAIIAAVMISAVAVMFALKRKHTL